MRKTWLVSALLGSLVLVGCEPRTPGQKVENAAEDAAHEVKQGAERAKENANNSVK